MSDQKQTPAPKLEPPVEDANRRTKDNSPTRAGRSISNADSSSIRNGNINPSPTRVTPASGLHSSIPSAAAVQRAISASKAGVSNLDGILDPARDRLQRSGQNSPSWPTSPRLKSPPPSTIKSMLPRRTENEHAQSNTAVKRLTPVSNPEQSATVQVASDNSKDQQNQPTIRAASRGVSQHGHALATVAEDSVSTSPAPVGPVPNSQATKSSGSALEQIFESSREPSVTKDDISIGTETSNRLNVAKPDMPTVSGPASRTASTSRPESILSKRSFTNLTGSKSKSGVEPLRSMTVETETVNSTPQIIGDRNRDVGSIRTRTSNETIRPKKEKKKPTRKTPSLHAGTATSKADIFEAKVASAVDEADSSDSDETFVYESNPRDQRQGRHHSRTPSATSVASQADHYGGRSKHGVRSGSTVIPGKRSMKFSSSLYGNQLDAEGSGGDGSRTSSRAHNSTARHHHIGRYGRNGHASIIDGDSPFTQANRVGSPRTPTAVNARYSRPQSPRLSNGRIPTPGRKSAAGAYEIYDDGADDERAPLVGSVRVNRSRHNRRPNGQFRSMEFNDDQEPGCWSRFGGCILLAMLFIVVCMGLTTFVVALNRPLLDVEVRHIQNVLVSEQELMLDLLVRATNPNLFAITVNDLDVNLFAESPYAGTSQEWKRSSPLLESSWMRRRRERDVPLRGARSWFPPFHEDDGVDEGTDPIDEEPGAQKLLLGRICEFDAPLAFDASPIRHSNISSVGEIRLAKPGNKTEIRGSERWERVIQHPFDLIVRGIIKYQLPLSSHTRSAKISGRVRVSPDVDDGDHDKKENETTPNRQKRYTKRDSSLIMSDHHHNS